MVHRFARRIRRSACVFIACGCLALGTVAQDSGQDIGSRFGEANKAKREHGAAHALPLYRNLAFGLVPVVGQYEELDWIYYLTAEVAVAICLQEMGDWQKSAAHLEAVLISENELALSNWCHAHAIAAESYLKGGLLSSALPHVEKGIAQANSALQHARDAEAAGESKFINRTGYAEAHLAAAKYVLATHHYEPALKILTDLVDVRFPGDRGLPQDTLGTVRTMLGLVRYQQHFEGGEVSDVLVREAYASALSLDKALLPRDRFSCLTRLAHLDLEAGRLDEARQSLAHWEWDSLAKWANAYDRAWFAALKNRQARESGGGGFPPFDSACSDLLNHLRGIKRDAGVGSYHYLRVRSVAFEAVAASLESGGATSALATLFRFEDIGFLNRWLAPERATLADLRESLEQDELCLLFSVGKTRILAFAVRKSGPIRNWTIQRSLQLHGAVEELASSVFVEDVGVSYEASALGLRDRLFPDDSLQALKGCKRIRLIGREALRNPLFEVFEFEGQPLGLTHAISDWPSTSIGLHLLKGATVDPPPVNRSIDWLLLAEPELSKEAQSLVPHAEALPFEFPSGARVQKLTGKQATFGQLLANPPALAVQFLCHGVNRDTPEWPACIALTADERLPTGLLSGMELLEEKSFLAPPLAVLSICRGEAGALKIGDPGSGRLAGTLLAKGSHSVLTSRGDAQVFLEPTTLFHHKVRERLVDGARLDDAVLAGRQALAQSERFASPAHWAAWQVIGSGALQMDLPAALKQTPASKKTWRWWLFGLAAALATVWAFARLRSSGPV